MIFILMSCSFSYSQFKFAPKAYIAITSVDRDSYFKVDSKQSFSFGFYGEYKFSKFAINAELNYIKIGYTTDKDEYRENEDDAPVLIKADYNSNQLNLLTTAKYYFTDRLSLRAGCYIGTVLDYKIDASIASINEKETLDISNQITKTDYGLTTGIEFEIYRGAFIDANYIYGLNDLYKNDVSTYNRILYFGLGYKF